MTATTSSPRHASPRRKRLRIASMESLGFIDNPGMATTWSDAVPATTGRHIAPPVTPQPITAEEILSGWKPNEIGKSLLTRNIRWSMIFGVLMIVAGVATLGLWLYQRPAAAAEAALADVQTVASDLESQIPVLESATAQLVAAGGLIPDLAAVDSAARDLFEASAGLDSLDVASRSSAADAASAALEASRLLRDAQAYMAGVAPILLLPEFETDAELITLDEAARFFGEWQSRFDQVRLALPVGTLSGITTELEIISGDLEAVQSRYLDALRENDRWGAISALTDLGDRLEDTGGFLTASVAQVADRVEQRIDEARAGLSALLG